MKKLTYDELVNLSGSGFFDWLGKAIGYAIHSYVDNWGYSDASHYTRKI